MKEAIKFIEVFGLFFCLFFVAYIFIGCEKQDPTVEKYAQKELVCEGNNLYAIIIGQKKQLLEQGGCKDGKVIMTREF